MIGVQPQDFQVQAHYDQLRLSGAGAVVVFVGLVRDFCAAGSVKGLFLEHYAGMTEQALVELAEQARGRWAIKDIHIVHRIGELAAHEQIVLVGVASDHRQQAFDAAQFLMDALKQRVPLWKKEVTDHSSHWVEAKESDQQALQRWHQCK